MPRRLPSAATPQQLFDRIRPERLTSSPLVDAELYKIVSLILRDYVCVWYQELSHDEEFLAKVVHTIGHAVQELEHNCLAKVDWVNFFAKNVPDVLRTHIHDYRNCKEKIGTVYAGGKSLEQLFHGCQPHFALENAETEMEYCRKIVDVLLTILLPEDELKSDCLRFSLREILLNAVLLPAIERFTDGDHINQLIVLVLSSSTVNDAYDASGASASEMPHVPEYSRDTLPSSSQLAPIRDRSSTHDPASNLSGREHLSLLFDVEDAAQPSFLKRRRTVAPHSSGTASSLVTKLTTGFETGLDKVSNRFGRIKNAVATPAQREQKCKLPLANPTPLSTASQCQDPTDITQSSRNDRDRTSMAHIEDAYQRGVASAAADVSGSGGPTNQNNERPQMDDGGTDDFASRSSDDDNSGLSIDSIYTDATEKSLDFDNLSEGPLKGKGTFLTSDVDSTKLPAFRKEMGESAAITLRDIWIGLLAVQREARSGPWMIGSIDTTQYEADHLEDNLIDFIISAIRLGKRRKWLYTQVVFFLKPIVQFFGGSLMNRLIIKGVHAIICEDMVAKYLLWFRSSMWPGNILADGTSDGTTDTSRKEATRREAETLLRNYVPPFGKDEVQDSLSDLVDMLQYTYINKHLFYVLLDLCMVHLAPEIVDMAHRRDK
ncbi:hypothetical protein SpCBS45565_g02891 [Spizellomyces sp. 'palustris']|nr:hypothetical protein SpCBS45565_g02891 [Spizellomyces sp. 'palustris']